MSGDRPAISPRSLLAAPDDPKAPNPAPRRRAPWPLLTITAALTLAGCTDTTVPAGERAPTRPMIVFGIDGGEWSVIEALWERGELPTLAALAERGAHGVLESDYGSSPMIWTTIATGRRPREHGITDFVLPSDHGDVPVSSQHRRVPALWNMTSISGRRVAVLGWWASWPAEEVEGVVVSDRVFRERERLTFPAELEADLKRFSAEPDGGGDGDAAWDRSTLTQRRDRVMSRFGLELASGALDPGGFDLMLVYFRGPDIESHNHWRWWEPEHFPPPDPRPAPAEAAELAERIPRVYRAVDRAIGEILAAAPADTNVLVVSDHGFLAAPEVRTRLSFDLDLVLERFGHLTREPDGAVDTAGSSFYTYASPRYRRNKLVRLGDSVPRRERPELRSRLEEELSRVTWAGGEPVFKVRNADGDERRQGADLVVIVLRPGATLEVRIDGRPFADPEAGDSAIESPVLFIQEITGVHERNTPGILIAAGPDIQPDADLGGISIHDMAPTILYGIGLPPADDFVGDAHVDLYTPVFRRAHPLTTIPSWGTRKPDGETRGESDQELIEELGALGYLN